MENNNWEINLDQWVLSDGNYSDFESGQPVQFALEITTPYHSLSLVNASHRDCQLLGKAFYRVSGEIIYTNNSLWVIDFGLCGYYEADTLAVQAEVGQWVSGEIKLGVDSFFYFREYNRLVQVPPLIYTWQVNRIIRQNSFFTYHKERSGLIVGTKDETKAKLDEIETTKKGMNEKPEPPYRTTNYYLYCNKLDSLPEYKKAR
ncbi:MAG TPA: hypothetical protein VH186_37970 [Chloroflexia bacterium]|nr:hypothetical protein [Chloroflexia bacterium]